MEIVLELPVSLDGTLIDVETTGFDPMEDELVTIGMISGSKMCIVQRTNESAETFLKRARNLAKEQARPYYAYYCPFESKWLGLPFNEVQPYDYAKKNKMCSISDELINDVLYDGNNVPDAWQKYKKTGDVRHLQLIVNHNIACLIKEVTILLAGHVKDKLEKQNKS